MRSSPKLLAGFLGGGVLSTLLWVGFTSLRQAKVAPGELAPRESSLVWTGPSGGENESESRAEARFELANVGDRSVRVSSVDSGCGCAIPKVSPEVVPPGGKAIVYVAALVPPAGEKTVGFTVHTDSPTKPDISLTLRIAPKRTPPFLFLLLGDLAFRGEFRLDLEREITLQTVEARTETRTPKLASDLPFLRISPIDIAEQPYQGTEAVLRTRRYRIRFTQAPPSPAFSGLIFTKAPWPGKARLTLDVFGQFHGGLTVAPSSVRLDGKKPRMDVMLIADGPFSAVGFEVEASPGLMLDILPDQTARPGPIRKVSIGLAEGRAKGEGQATIRFRRAGSKGEAVVSVTVGGE